MLTLNWYVKVTFPNKSETAEVWSSSELHLQQCTRLVISSYKSFLWFIFYEYSDLNVYAAEIAQTLWPNFKIP